MKYTEQLDREIFYSILDLEAGDANPNDARKLMQYFCDFHDSGDIPPRLLKHFRRCFEKILHDKTVSTEQALGLKKTRRPPAEEIEEIATATTFLKLQLSGATWDDAAKKTTSQHNVSKSTAEKRLKKHRTSAVDMIKIERGKDSSWTSSERKILETIFS